MTTDTEINLKPVSATVTVSDVALRSFVTAAYASVYVPLADAERMADALVQADLWGHQSHGVLRASWYLERLRHRVMTANTQIDVVRDRGCVAVLDGRDGIGQVVAQRGTELAIEKAKAHGVGTVAIRNSNHFGTLMYYTAQATRHGCIAFFTSNGGPAMAPWGGAKHKIIGTNPWSIAAPVGTAAPMLLDMANTGVARGKIYLARQRGESIPEGWALDAEGRPTTDPTAAIGGLILPMAHHKGYAIAALMDVFAGVLTGSRFLSAVNGPYHHDKTSGAGHFMTVYDIEAFMPRAEFDERMQAFVAEIKAQPLAEGFDEIFYPGELESRHDRRQREQGIALPADTWADLEHIAGETGTTAWLAEVRPVA